MLTAISRPTQTPEDALDLFTLFESEDDIDRLCTHMDPNLCGLTFDTAHAAKGLRNSPKGSNRPQSRFLAFLFLPTKPKGTGFISKIMK